MIQNKFGEMIFSESDVCDLVMQGRDLDSLRGMLVDPSVNIEQVIRYVENYNGTLSYPVLQADNVSVPAFDLAQQKNWHMPDHYKNMDIAQHVLALCQTEDELQRCGQELLLYQARDLFPLLQYLTYLVDVMRDNRENRIVPVEMSVLAVGYEQDGKVHHLLPPRPPLSLDVIYLCDDKDLVRFTEKFGYFRHILNAKDAPIGEVIAAHIQQASAAHKDKGWKDRATQEVITLMSDDYPTLMSVLGALGEVI